MFDSTKKDLKDILRDAHEGKLQLPDFQRDYVWEDDDVLSLLASIAKGYPVGSLLTLQTGGEVAFKPRLIAGVPDRNRDAEELLLDGQQRITSLYQSLFSKRPVRTKTRKNTEIERFYYIDIVSAVEADADLSEALLGVPADRVVRRNFGKDIERDLSSAECEYEQSMFPLNSAFDSRTWFYGWRDYWRDHGRDVSDLEKKFDQGILERIQRYEMPIIKLDRKNSREAICLVFEKVNVGGVKLDAFELLTAVYAASRFDLREAWSGDGTKKNSGIRGRLVGTEFPRGVLRTVESTSFMQACTLLNTREIRIEKEKAGAKGKELPQVLCNREALLGLPLGAFQKHSRSVEHAFVEAAAFLNDQKILGRRDVPYPAQTVVLAAVFAVLDNDAKSIPAKDKLKRWFWSSALGELYGSSPESRMARDFSELVAWIRETGDAPRSLDEAIFQQDRLRTLRGRVSAAYKAIHALLMRSGCKDFIHGDGVELMTYFGKKIDVHHIFPQKWAKHNRIERKVYDSIINKTPLSKRSNQVIGGHAPSIYLKKIEQETKVSAAELDEILRTHLIEPKHLRNDDFESFYQARKEALSSMVSSAMGKAVVLGAGADEREIELPDVEENDEEVGADDN